MSPSDCNGKPQQCDLPAGEGGSASRLRVGYATGIPSSVRYRRRAGLAGLSLEPTPRALAGAPG